MNVEYLRWTSELVNVFLEGGKSLGYRVGDLNGELTSGGILILNVLQKTQIDLRFYGDTSDRKRGAAPQHRCSIFEQTEAKSQNRHSRTRRKGTLNN
jgi:hypothetical protein